MTFPPPPKELFMPLCSQPLGWEDPLEEGMAIHSSILAWRIPWTEEPDRVHRVTESDTAEVT